MTGVPACLLTIFAATGHWAPRMLLPSFYGRQREGLQEMPIGHRLSRSIAVNDDVAQVFDEGRVFRVRLHPGKAGVRPNALVTGLQPDEQGSCSRLPEAAGPDSARLTA